MAVGFADLAALLMAFERTAYDLVAELDGRVVKTLDDGVLYSSESPIAAANIALALACLADELPPVHVGLGWGPVLMRQGDCFGPTVNLVSRLVDCAAGGEVVIDRAMADEISTERPLRRRCHG